MQKLLTDFNLPRWKNYHIPTIKAVLERISRQEVLGEVGHVSNDQPENPSHRITNIHIVDNQVFGDVEFFDSSQGKLASEMISSGGRFSIRATHQEIKEVNYIRNILAWDVF